MPYTVEIDKAIPGTALSSNEANRLKKEIATYFEGLQFGLEVKRNYGPFDFKDDQKIKRKYRFRVLKLEKKKEGEKIHIEITEFLTI